MLVRSPSRYVAASILAGVLCTGGPCPYGYGASASVRFPPHRHCRHDRLLLRAGPASSLGGVRLRRARWPARKHDPHCQQCALRATRRASLCGAAVGLAVAASGRGCCARRWSPARSGGSSSVFCSPVAAPLQPPPPNPAAPRVRRRAAAYRPARAPCASRSRAPLRREQTRQSFARPPHPRAGGPQLELAQHDLDHALDL